MKTVKLRDKIISLVLVLVMVLTLFPALATPSEEGGDIAAIAATVGYDEVLRLPIAMFAVHGSRMDRGAIVQEVANGVFLAWRFFPSEVTGTSDTAEYRGLIGNNFVIYRNGELLTQELITTSTNYIDATGQAGDVYVIVTVNPAGQYISRTEEIVARPQSATAGDYISIPLVRPAAVKVPHWDLLDPNMQAIAPNWDLLGDGFYQWAQYEQDIVMVGDLTGNGQLDFVVVWQTSCQLSW